MKTVLFACVHNAGRSQMAAAWFNKLADPSKASAISAGTVPGERVHPEVVEVMKEVGMDLSGEDPKLLSDALARSAALLITMGCGDACPVVPGLRRDDWPLEDRTVMDTADPFHGREWESANVDLQYACTFELPKQKDCADPGLASACDCGPGKTPPLCAAGDPALPRVQVRGKAYPGIRQLTVARDLGDQGIVASLCARKTDEAARLGNDPDYGYRPAVRAVVDHAKKMLRNACAPVPHGCMVIEILAHQGADSECSAVPGLSALAPGLTRHPEAVGRPVCVLQELAGSCAASGNAGWCNGPSMDCKETLFFSPTGSPQAGADVEMFCP